LALIQYCGLKDERTGADEDALMSALSQIAPQIAEIWPPLRDRETILAGVEERRENVSEVWAWLGSHRVARSYAKRLFRDVEITVVPKLLQQTAEGLNALLRTTSIYHRLSPGQQQALQLANAEISERLGRPLRSSVLGVLVTARSALHA
jgi:hypothetical protein